MNLFIFFFSQFYYGPNVENFDMLRKKKGDN